MGLGIVEPKRATDSHVPGTSYLYEDSTGSQGTVPVGAKHDSGSDAPVILVPQPSDSPNDPLNWPKWKRELTFFSICYSVAMGAVLSPILATIVGDVVKEFHISFNQAALLQGYPLLTSGCAALITQVWSRILGKRSAYVISTVILFATTVWNAKVTSFNEFLACRTVEGLGNGAYESIVISSVGDLYFVHERGKRLVLYNMVTLGVVALSPIIGGYVSDKYGWREQFVILSPFIGVGVLLLVFFCPEHAYNRDKVYETDMASTEHLFPEKTTDSTKATSDEEGKHSGASVEPKRTYVQELMPFHGIISRENPIKLFLRPFVCCFYPTVFWAFTAGGLWSAWNTGNALVLAQLFSVPPHLFTPTRLGYIFTFPFVFSLLAYALGTFLSDWSPKLSARHNHGIFEPEFRMILLIPVSLIGIPALFGFGAYAVTSNVHWVPVSVLYGLIVFAVILAATTSFSYILDSHRSQSVEVSVAYCMLRNFFWFGSSYFFPTWLEVDGPKKMFEAVGGIQLGITVLSIPVYIYGKVIRNWIHQVDPMGKLRLN